MTAEAHGEPLDMPEAPDLFGRAAPRAAPEVAAGPLHLVDLRFDLRDLWRAIRHDGRRIPDADDGYAVHAALFALFGQELPPKPFALLPVAVGAREQRVLGYARADEATLRAAAERAEPAWRQALTGLRAKAMPRAEEWRPGLRVAFQLRARPTMRRHKEVDGHKRDLERDAYQLEILSRGELGARSREAVYVDWLREQIERAGGATPVQRGDGAADFRLRGWRLSPVYRKAGPVAGSRDAKRGTHLMTLPEAEFEGVLEITEPAAFHAMLARGIGRHRAFGYGMLLVRRAE